MVCRVYAKREIAPKDAKKNVPTVQYNDCRVLVGDIDGLPFALPLQKIPFFSLSIAGEFVFPFFLKRIRLSSGKLYKRVYARDSK